MDTIMEVLMSMDDETLSSVMESFNEDELNYISNSALDYIDSVAEESSDEGVSGMVTGKIKRFSSVTKDGITKTKGDVTDYAMPINKVKGKLKKLKSKILESDD